MAEVYGTAFLEEASGLIVAQLNALKITMAVGYDPTFSYVYARHQVAKLQLNAVTVQMEQVPVVDNATLMNDEVLWYKIPFSIRVHTAYVDGINDGQKQMRLLNSIANKLKANIGLGDDLYRVDDVGEFLVGETFEESATHGGSLVVIVMTKVEHTQE